MTTQMYISYYIAIIISLQSYCSTLKDCEQQTSSILAVQIRPPYHKYDLRNAFMCKLYKMEV